VWRFDRRSPPHRTRSRSPVLAPPPPPPPRRERDYDRDYARDYDRERDYDRGRDREYDRRRRSRSPDRRRTPSPRRMDDRRRDMRGRTPPPVTAVAGDMKNGDRGYDMPRERDRDIPRTPPYDR
jgi:splicing factor, arginine/serine-rich 2